MMRRKSSSGSQVITFT
ncbi:rCG45245 [Rattus norvegicus]|uniref:RCG45245 n=1 Tax=Rattus norvegicus TaxID=10116 RepID=A6KLD5_RAT|nr:rCG45245 [Rattus norvegicus]